MFKPVDKSITPINEHTFLKFIDSDAPYYSKLELYHDNQLISDCSFKPQEQRQIKDGVNNFENLMRVLKNLNQQIHSAHLGNFIELIESHNVSQQNRPVG